MSVQKFRSLEEAQKALWNLNPDKRYYDSLHELFELAGQLNPLTCVRGVQKFMSFRQAEEQRIKENVRRQIL